MMLISQAFVSSNPKCVFARNQLGKFMKPAKKVEYSDTPKYDKLVELMRQRAAEDGRNMSDAEIHRSARNLMGYVEFMIRTNREELK